MNEVARERAQSLLKPEHQERIHGVYRAFADEEGLARVATRADIAEQGWSLSIPLFVKRKVAAVPADGKAHSLAEAWEVWEASGLAFWTEVDAVADMLDGLVGEDEAEASRE